jgi:hypothetical protein
VPTRRAWAVPALVIVALVVLATLTATLFAINLLSCT